MNDDKTNGVPSVVVVLTIFVLLIFIILPPVFRVLLPKNNTEVNIVNDNISILNCRKSGNDYDLSINSKYINGRIQNTTLNYKKINNEAMEDSEFVFQTEIDFLKLLNGIIFNEMDDQIKFTIDKNIIDSNPTYGVIKNYLDTLDNEKKYFTNSGYVCNEINS